MARTSYDPGTCPSTPVKVGPGLYSVPSFRSEETDYMVTLTGRNASCTCPHWEKRIKGTSGACKHIVAARKARFEAITKKAKTLPDAQLPQLLARYEAAGNTEIAIALRGELFDRTAAAARDAELKAMFS